eukprot:scaffold43448_cov51-Cyclotella_meneghiniana.AAC.5
MPSRKKAQGQTRKAKQAAAATAAHGGGNPTCLHFDEPNDFDLLRLECSNIVFDGYVTKVRAIGDGISREKIMKLSNDFYVNSYQHCSDVMKDLIRRMIIYLGTQCCLLSAAEWNYTRFGTYFMLLLTIEARDRYNGAWNSYIYGEVMRSMSDIVQCPRATIRFFHRRNSCNCLQEMYYNLKETTKRTSWCWNCSKIVDIKLMKECTFCKITNYCSCECAVACWPKHKKDCRLWRKQKEKSKERTDSFNDIDAVD